MLEPEVFWKQMHCIEDSTLLGHFVLNVLYWRKYIFLHGWTFWRPPQSFGARGIVPPFPPSLNTSLRQRGQRSVALNHYLSARRVSTNHGSHCSAVSSNAETWQNTDYLQLGGMINWLYAVMTNFDLWLNTWSSKFKRSAAPIVPPVYAPGNSDWWPYDFDLILLNT